MAAYCFAASILSYCTCSITYNCFIDIQVSNFKYFCFVGNFLLSRILSFSLIIQGSLRFIYFVLRGLSFIDSCRYDSFFSLAVANFILLRKACFVSCFFKYQSSSLAEEFILMTYLRWYSWLAKFFCLKAVAYIM